MPTANASTKNVLYPFSILVVQLHKQRQHASVIENPVPRGGSPKGPRPTPTRPALAHSRRPRLRDGATAFALDSAAGVSEWGKAPLDSPRAGRGSQSPTHVDVACGVAQQESRTDRGHFSLRHWPGTGAPPHLKVRGPRKISKQFHGLFTPAPCANDLNTIDYFDPLDRTADLAAPPAVAACFSPRPTRSAPLGRGRPERALSPPAFGVRCRVGRGRVGAAATNRPLAPLTWGGAAGWDGKRLAGRLGYVYS